MIVLLRVTSKKHPSSAREAPFGHGHVRATAVRRGQGQAWRLRAISAFIAVIEMSYKVGTVGKTDGEMR